MDKKIFQPLADNPLLLSELRKAFTKEFENMEVTEEMSDEEIGEHVRAKLVGLRKIDGVFVEIESCASKNVGKVEEMPAR